MSDLAEMLKAQTEAVNAAFKRGLAQGKELGRQQGYREGRAAGLEEARQLLEGAFPNGKLPAILTRQGE